jgi:acyl-CoA thioester hydrolase
MGVAYYANYLRWFEMGRTDWLRQAGVPYTSIEASGLFFPVAEVSCRYQRPARYDEALTIETTLVSVRRASLVFSYTIYRVEGEVFLAEGKTTHACINRLGQITKIPSVLIKRLKAAAAPQEED